MRTSARTSMYKPNGKRHVRAAFKMSYKHLDVRGSSHFCVHTPSLCVGIPPGRAVSVHTPSPSVAIASDHFHSWVPVHECTRTVGGVGTPRAVCVHHLRCVCTYPRSYTIQMLTDDFYGMRTPFFVCLGV